MDEYTDLAGFSLVFVPEQAYNYEVTIESKRPADTGHLIRTQPEQEV